MSQEREYDIFISYAHENMEWVNNELYMHLKNCYTQDKRRPRIFMDIKKEGLKVGVNFVDALTYAIQNSKIVIPIYSQSYFKKEMTLWELEMIFKRDPRGLLGLINPILIDETAETSIPLWINSIQYLDIRIDDWLDRLLDNIGFSKIQEKKPAKLVFITQPSDNFINLTLPVIKIELHNEDGILDRQEVVTISAENGEMHGTTSKITEQGQVLFSDLSFGNVVNFTRLLVHAEGYNPVFSNSFSIKVPKTIIKKVEKEFIEIPCQANEIIFFDNGKAFICFKSENIYVYNNSGEKLSEIPYSSKSRIIKRHGALLAIGCWSGEILLIRDNGEYQTFSLSDQNWGFSIPGDITFARGNAYVGFWNGVVYILSSTGKFEREFVHEGGVQNLAAIQDSFYVCDLVGHICIFQENKITKAYKIEPSIHFLKSYRDCIVAIGEQKIYQLSLTRNDIIEESYPMLNTSIIFGDVDQFIVMDNNGKGIRYDKNLTIRSRFHTISTAIPVSADNKGRICIFQYPDKSRALMIESRIVYNHMNGPLAISPQGKHIVMGDQDGLKIYDDTILLKLHKGKEIG